MVEIIVRAYPLPGTAVHSYAYFGDVDMIDSYRHVKGGMQRSLCASRIILPKKAACSVPNREIESAACCGLPREVGFVSATHGWRITTAVSTDKIGATATPSTVLVR